MEDKWVDDGKEEIWFGLIGKVLSGKPICLSFFKDLLHGLWRPKSSIDINQMLVDIFLFNFCDMVGTYQAFAMSLIHF